MSEDVRLIPATRLMPGRNLSQRQEIFRVDRGTCVDYTCTPARAGFLQWGRLMDVRALLAVACFPLALSLTPHDYTRLNGGESIVELLPADEKEVAVRAITQTSAHPGGLIEWTRQIEALHTGRYVAAIGRFSQPPRLTDLEGLSLDEEDLTDLRRCRPGKCGVKLSDVEIARVRETIAKAGPEWKDAVQETFRRIVLSRAVDYMVQGHTSAVSYHDAKKPVLLDSEFAAIASEVGLAHPRLFPLTNLLSLYPRGDMPDTESFLYWSKEVLGAKPIVSITQVVMIESRGQGRHEALVARKQVYASHYILASLSLTAISAAPDGTQRYLVYLNRSRSDVFDGLFGGLIRRTIARRLRAEAPQALQTLRQKLESAPPD
jgi:hypothetical protein